MTIFSTENIPHKHRFFIKLIPIFIIALASILPIWQTFGKLSVGGDVIIPLIPKFAYHNAYEWVEYTNGLYASSDYFIWISLFYAINKIFNSIYITAFVFQYLILFSSTVGIYSLFNLFNSKSKWWGLLSALAFLYSPYQYDHMHYFYGTTAIIWLFYILFKFLKTKQISLIDIFFISVLLGCIGNLPNPKYHFLVTLTFFLVILISLFLKILRVEHIKKNIFYILLIILGSLYISLPFIQFGHNFSSDTTIKVTTVDKEVGKNNQTLDYGHATLSKMLTLWHTPGLNKDDTEILNSDLFTLSFYALAIVVFAVFPVIFHKLSKEQKQIYLVYYILAASFIFLSKSSNAPFGDYYYWLMSNIRILAFLRTTAGIVIFAAIFYSLIIGITVQTIFQEYKKFNTLFMMLIITTITIAGFFSWSGKHFRNFSPVNAFIDTTQHGLRIPGDYFKAANFLANFSLSTKIDVLPGALGYQNNTWGYFGPIIYPWIFKQPTITVDKNNHTTIFPNLASTRYVIYDKSVIISKEDKTALNRTLRDYRKIFTSPTINIYQKHDSQFVPLLYSYTVNEQGVLPVDTEYKYINPTKFVVRLHHVNSKFSLIFTSNYNSLWELYTNKITPQNNLSNKWNNIKTSYSISQQNQADQASTEEIEQFITNGVVSTLGENKSNHTDFISKSFRNSVQNNNISSGIIMDTLFKQKTPIDSHTKENGFANKWLLDANTVCGNNHFCYKNNDGSYDIELIGEFKPQQYVYCSYLISFITLSIVCVGYLINRKYAKHTTFEQ